jgi:hypothetical protein
LTKAIPQAATVIMSWPLRPFPTHGALDGFDAVT